MTRLTAITRLPRRPLVAIAASAALFVTGVGAAPAGGVASDVGIGDPYYPADGNPGYNVSAYHVVMNYLPQRFSLSAVTAVHARASQRLPSWGSGSRR